MLFTGGSEAGKEGSEVLLKMLLLLHLNEGWLIFMIVVLKNLMFDIQ